MEPQLKRKRGAEEEETTGNTAKVKIGNNEENRRKEEKVEKQVNNEEDDLAELDKFVISAMLAGVPFLKAKIKTFAKKKENRLKERLDELGEELALKKTSQELRMLSSVTINCQITKIVMNSGSQLSEL